MCVELLQQLLTLENLWQLCDDLFTALDDFWQFLTTCEGFVKSCDNFWQLFFYKNKVYKNVSVKIVLKIKNIWKLK